MCIRDRGPNRALDAAKLAISSPLLESSIDGARGVLLMIAGGSDVGLFEVNEAAEVITKAAHTEANIIFGAVIDDSLGDEVKVTVIAAGFDRPGVIEQTGTFVATNRSTSSVAAAIDDDFDDEDEDEDDEMFRPSATNGAAAAPRVVSFDADDDLDIPSFLK